MSAKKLKTVPEELTSVGRDGVTVIPFGSPVMVVLKTQLLPVCGRHARSRLVPPPGDTNIELYGMLSAAGGGTVTVNVAEVLAVWLPAVTANVIG